MNKTILQTVSAVGPRKNFNRKGPGKNAKLITVRPTSIPDSRVLNTFTYFQ